MVSAIPIYSRHPAPSLDMAAVNKKRLFRDRMCIRSQHNYIECYYYMRSASMCPPRKRGTTPRRQLHARQPPRKPVEQYCRHLFLQNVPFYAA